MRSRSKATAKLYREQRVPLIEAMIERGDMCEACPKIYTFYPHMFTPAHPLHKAQTLHELRKRSANGSIVNPLNLMPVCNWANNWVETWPLESKEIDLVMREGHPHWDEVSARHDK